MTNAVIRQAAKMEIETKSVTSYDDGMKTMTKMTMQTPLQSELRPARIGERLRLLREALGLKPSEMADRLGIERTYWSRFEGGKRPITNDVAALLVERFGVTLDFILLGRKDKLPLDLAGTIDRIERANNSSTDDPDVSA
jgi:transcriptional regulator with XRE-family HTH domain